eukprot:TRINITY_DN32888_c0_g1_i1.p1 TRINITY_DN32888_c0_g1~~TRINITY_DN32888_c0_g1_i1.p1  ORF type:complete len:375 (+),score=89.91 TRINITY_DN32888_c0_g1_i1:82-1206(+)
MIQYNPGDSTLKLVFRLRGSVFPQAFFIAAVEAAISASLKWAELQGLVDWLIWEDSVLTKSAAYGGFSFLVGFIIVFRTDRAYGRFWEAITATTKMRGEWYACTAQFFAFCQAAKAERAVVLQFQSLLIRLFSLLHAAAWSEVQGPGPLVTEEVMQVLDASGLDDESIRAVLRSHHPVPMIFEWIQQVAVDHIKKGVMTIAPPILSRPFANAAEGMVFFHQATLICMVPFPFPYAQTCEFLLLMHFLISPLVTCMWVDTIYACAGFSFVQCFPLFALNYIATDIENPFGHDQNDLDGYGMHNEFNQQLLMLLQLEQKKTPHLSSDAIRDPRALRKEPPRYFESIKDLSSWASRVEAPEAGRTASVQSANIEQKG